MLDITKEGKRLNLINIYGPNRDSPDFYTGILTFIKQSNNPVIPAGNFNLLLDPAMDTQNYININSPKARGEVLDMKTECNLIAFWRELNLETFQYTWRKKNTNTKVPKLGDSENVLLEGPITYDEMLLCLKKTNNNTSNRKAMNRFICTTSVTEGEVVHIKLV